MATLEWNKLLCTKRERESKSGSSINPVRNEFEADYDRIVGSSSVRRLQDKAQVFPLQQNRCCENASYAFNGGFRIGKIAWKSGWA